MTVGAEAAVRDFGPGFRLPGFRMVLGQGMMGPQMGMIGQGPQALRAVACASCRLFSLKNVQEPGLPMLLGKAGRGCTYIRTCMHAYANTHTDRQRQTETDRHIHTNISTYVRTPVCLHARTPACTPARDAHTHTHKRVHVHTHTHAHDTHTPTHARHRAALHCMPMLTFRVLQAVRVT